MGGSGNGGDGWRHAGGDAIRSLVRMPKSPSPRLAVSVRAALAIGLPLALGTLLVRPDLGLQAAAGAFAPLFASALPPRERIKVLSIVSLALLVCAALGALFAPWVWVLAAGLVLLAPVATALSLAYRLGPPGPVFFVLMYGLASNVTGLGADGERRADPWLFLGLVAAGSILSAIVTLAPLALPRHFRAAPRPLRELLPGPWLGSGESVLVARVAVVAVVGTVISVIWLDDTHAYWTVAAGVAVVGVVPVRRVSLERALHRTLGTVLGALLFLLVAPLVTVPWVLVAALVLLQFAIEMTVVRNYALALAFITPLVLFINEAAMGAAQVHHVAMERVSDTVVGSALAVLTALMHRTRTPG
ncbi:FUSC family protein [Leucobacter sp. W1038]|uniref:FUSC family protein n=1 Tax=Leucobacter sp. W1038 TaxID=3438281 RepID=UPI003D994C7E